MFYKNLLHYFEIPMVTTRLFCMTWKRDASGCVICDWYGGLI